MQIIFLLPEAERDILRLTNVAVTERQEDLHHIAIMVNDEEKILAKTPPSAGFYQKETNRIPPAPLGRMDNNLFVDRELDAGNMLLKKEANDNRLLLRRGTVGNDRDGTPLLINGRGEAYRVNDTAISLWHMCNGITFEDLYHEVLRISSGDDDDVKKSLEQMVRQFYEISLVDIKKVSAGRRPGTQT